MIAAMLLAVLQLNAADDSLMVRGVSHALARYRATHTRNVHYDLALDVTSRDTARGSMRVAFDRVRGGDAIVDFRGFAMDDVRVNDRRIGKVEWAGTHLHVPAELLRDGRNTIDARFTSAIAPAGAAV